MNPEQRGQLRVILASAFWDADDSVALEMADTALDALDIQAIVPPVGPYAHQAFRIRALER